jgi:lipopolysaccharide assembly outer membrane protein LptD (OstA)
MINKFFKKYFFYLSFVLFFSLITNQQNASEILIYADQITYDQKKNIIAKGKAKILYENQIISSDLIIYSQTTGNITLPIEFSLKDERNNYYYGSNGVFESNFEFGNIDNVKVLLEDGSRIVGKNIKRDRNVDIISKGVYSPCNSRIKIADFLCPIWQIESEKMLHDYYSLISLSKTLKIESFQFTSFLFTVFVNTITSKKREKKWFFNTINKFKFF